MLEKIRIFMDFFNRKKRSLIIFVVINIIVFILGFNCNIFINKGVYINSREEILVKIWIVFFIISTIYLLFYDYLKKWSHYIIRAKYVFISADFALFLYYYNLNEEYILASIEKGPSFMPKSTFAFILYFIIFVIFNILIITILTRSVKSFSISKNTLEVEFEKNIVKGLTYITDTLNYVYANNVALYQNLDEIIEITFEDVTIRSEVDINVFFDFYKEIINYLFEDTGVCVNIRIEYKNNFEGLKNIINDIDTSALSKTNIFEDIIHDKIVQFERYIFIPVSMKLIETNVVIILNFNNIDETLSSLGNIVFSLSLYAENSIKSYLLEKELERLNKGFNLGERND